MAYPRDFYGSYTQDETFRLEVGARVASSYDEAFAIEGRLIKAGYSLEFGDFQLEWMMANRLSERPPAPTPDQSVTTGHSPGTGSAGT